MTKLKNDLSAPLIPKEEEGVLAKVTVIEENQTLSPYELVGQSVDNEIEDTSPPSAPFSEEVQQHHVEINELEPPLGTLSHYNYVHSYLFQGRRIKMLLTTLGFFLSILFFVLILSSLFRHHNNNDHDDIKPGNPDSPDNS